MTPKEALALRNSLPAFPTEDEAARCAFLAAHDPACFAGVLQSLGDGDLEGARRSLRVGTARALYLDKQDPQDPGGEDPEVALRRETIAIAGREAAGNLLRLCLTVPRWHGSIRIIANRFVKESSAGGYLLATDRRSDSSEHIYGLAIGDAARSVEEWVGLTKASEKCCRAGLVTGWREFRETGDVGLLGENLERILRYQCKAWPDGRPRRPSDVFASGALEPLREGLVRLAVPGMAYGLDASKVPPRGGKALAAGCAWCGGSLEGVRSHAVFCRPSCRVSASRARGRS
jgi:hypothetical protein